MLNSWRDGRQPEAINESHRLPLSLKKTLAAGALSLILFLGGNTQNDPAENEDHRSRAIAAFAVFLGGYGLFYYGGIRGLTHFIDRSSEKSNRDETAILGWLPELQGKLYSKPFGEEIKNRDLGTVFLNSGRFALKSKSGRTIDTIPSLALEDFFEDVEHMVYMSTTKDNDTQVALVAATEFLDEVAPISKECLVTPEGVDGQKHWIDFIHRRAQEQPLELVAWTYRPASSEPWPITGRDTI